MFRIHAVSRISVGPLPINLSIAATAARYAATMAALFQTSPSYLDNGHALQQH